MSKKQKETTVTIPEFKPEDMPLSCTWIVIGPPGSGKCLAKNTPVLMFDGSIKKVQNIKKGDLLMGDDSTPREVLSTCRGEEDLYKITQFSSYMTSASTPETYTVNESHILSLKNRVGNVKDISVRDFLSLPSKERKTYFGYKVGVDFIGQKTPFDPYLFGCWILNAQHNRIYSGPAILYIEDICEKYGIKTKKNGENVVVSGDLPFIDNPSFKADHIPEVFLKNSRPIRLAVLAGMIDNYGSLEHDGSLKLNITGNDAEKLGKDVVYLARSLGFTCNYIGHENFTLNIYGNVKDIPVKLLSNRPVMNHSHHSSLYNLIVDYVEHGEYYGFELDGNRRFLLGDFTVTHNTTFMENMAYYRKHLYPVGRVFIGTEDGYKKFCDIFHPLYVSNYWDEEEEKKHVQRQRTCEMENGRGYPGNYAINIIDDVSDDPKIYKTKLMRGLFKLGSQHWAQLCMIGTQYAIDMPPDIRKAVSYVAIGREPEEIERKKLFENFGGLAGSYNKFCDLMDQITGDHTFLIFKKRSQSNNLEECISWYQTKKLGPWKFGCKEYRAHAEERYDKNYIEQIIL